VRRPRIAILGAGAAGSAVGRALRRSGWPVGAVCRRNLRRARAAARLVGGGARAFTDPVRAVRGAGLVLLAVRDGEIAPAAAALAEARAVEPGALVIHLAGAVPSAALAPLRAGGARTAALHPLQTFAGGPGNARGPGPLAGVSWFHEGDAKGECAALVRRLGGRMGSIEAGRKALYHAAAAAASNYLVAVEALAARLAEAAGIPSRDALRALLPLVRGTVGLPGALTGPVARGDAATLRAHRRALREVDPALDASYAALGRLALRVALEAGLDPRRARETARALR